MSPPTCHLKTGRKQSSARERWSILGVRPQSAWSEGHFILGQWNQPWMGNVFNIGCVLPRPNATNRHEQMKRKVENEERKQITARQSEAAWQKQWVTQGLCQYFTCTIVGGTQHDALPRFYWQTKNKAPVTWTLICSSYRSRSSASAEVIKTDKQRGTEPGLLHRFHLTDPRLINSTRWEADASAVRECGGADREFMGCGSHGYVQNELMDTLIHRMFMWSELWLFESLLSLRAVSNLGPFWLSLTNKTQLLKVTSSLWFALSSPPSTVWDNVTSVQQNLWHQSWMHITV